MEIMTLDSIKRNTTETETTDKDDADGPTARKQRSLNINDGKLIDAKMTDFSSLFFKDLLPHNDNNKITDQFVNEVVKKLVEFLRLSNDRNTQILNFLPPEEITQYIDFELKEESENLDGILKHIDSILKYSVKTAHPRFYNQLWAGIDVNCLMGQWVTSATNTSVYTYEMAPVYTMMEKFILEKLGEYVGYKDGDGMFFPGGSICNLAAMSLARYKYCPDLKEKGLFGCKKLITYTSEEGHYSTKKAAATLGFGTDNVVKIKSDMKGKMICADLEKQVKLTIEKGEQPFFVVATAGTTVGGAYDPIDEIAIVCEKYNIWLHVDGAYGGSCLVSNKHRHLMKGVDRADSITWDPHKLMNCLQQCTILLIKHKGLFKKCNGTDAKYLFQKDKKLYDVSWDSGDKTFQCGRLNDVLKLWLMWKAKGTSGIEEQVNLAFSNARYLADAVKKRDNFQLLREPEYANVCFQYSPPRITAMVDGPEKEEQLSKVPPEIKKRMTLNGTMMIGYQPLKDYLNFFRMVTMNPASTPDDMEFVLDEIERLGCDL